MNLKDRVVALTIGQQPTEERKLIRELWSALGGAEAELKWHKKVINDARRANEMARSNMAGLVPRRKVPQ